MRPRASLFLLGGTLAIALAAGAGLTAGCAGEHSDDFTPPVSQAPTSPVGTATQPSMATFNASVEPFLTSNTCSNTGCHASPGTGTSGHPYSVSASDAAANYAQTVCNPRLSAYGANPAGNFLSHFCSSPTAGLNHSGITATSQNCTDFYNWAKEGNGAPPNCSP